MGSSAVTQTTLRITAIIDRFGLSDAVLDPLRRQQSQPRPARHERREQHKRSFVPDPDHVTAVYDGLFSGYTLPACSIRVYTEQGRMEPSGLPWQLEN